MASRGINKVILVGNLGQDPDVRHTKAGEPVATLSLATSETWKDQAGQPQERTEWHRVVLFGKLAEIAQQYLHKGSKVYIEGQLRTRKWQHQDGSDRYTTEIHLGYNGTIQLLDRKEGTAPPHPAASDPNPQPNPPARAPQDPPPFDDDIPF